MEQNFCHSRRVFPIALLLVVFIWFPCLITNSYYNHEIYIEDGGVGDDEIDGAIYMEELLEILSNGTEQLPEVLSSAADADAVDLEMGRGLIATNHKQGEKKDFEVFHEEEKIAMITNKNEETAQENNVEGEMKNIVFHDENGIPPDSFFTLNLNPYEPKIGHRKELKSIMLKINFI
ncbi:hypothetical protein COLO4_30493 [Corchorus olitorius]|uniref:Uncharacterized protein n=1 Tax=Corchorus olitorius TaxID=93759 RepID=A0A1R3H8D2_9ROSI|nr:hypothetical protein COLO4_30493 [Corchorus olitorius]